MILLADHFVFASDFSGWIEEWAGIDHAVQEDRPFWVIEDPRKMGNLHGAMAGEDQRGLIGASYVRYPFPKTPEDFKQDPDGHSARPHLERLAREHAGSARAVPVVLDPVARTFSVGPYLFDAHGFSQLVRYLWLGGMPRWRDGRRPAYIEAMMTAVRRSRSPLFADPVGGE